MNYQSDKNGFTLIEVLVTILITGSLGVVASSILFSLLRGASKTEILKEVKQNGDYAITVMEIKVRNSTITDTNCTGTPINNLNIQMNDATQTQLRYSCNAGRLEERIIGTTPPAASPTTANNLTNTSVTIPTCTTTDISFTCTLDPITKYKTVVIKFTLRQASGATSAETAQESFQTQVALRNK